MSRIDSKSNTANVKDVRSSKTLPSNKVFVTSSKGSEIQNHEHPWYLFPEEDMDDFSVGDSSDSSSTSGDEENTLIDKIEVIEKDDGVSESASVVETDKKAYSCSVCGKEYKKKGHLERHSLKHLEEKNNVSKLHVCEHCGYQASRIGNIKKHMLTHSGERPFSCDICGKSFRQKAHLKDHLRSHSGEREFECNVCGATFVQKSSLKLHEKKHTGIRPYTCHLCERSFFENQHLVNHKRTHTGEKPYQCETCGQTFSTFRTLRTHRMIHTGERPYKCEICNVSFREKSTLQKHKGVHINVGPFPCSDCGKEFSRLASLTLHRKIHLPISSNVPLQSGASNHNCKFKPKIESEIENERIAIGKENTQGSNHKEEAVQPNNVCTIDYDVATTSLFKEEKFGECKSTSKGLLSTLELVVDRKIDRDFHGSSLNKAVKNAVGLKSPRKCSVAFDKIQKTSANVTPSLENIPHPDHVREALEFGTVVETKDEDGNDFIIVLPAILSNQDIILTSHNNETILPVKNHRPTSEKVTSVANEIKSINEEEFRKVVGSDITVSKAIDKFPRGVDKNKEKECELGIRRTEHTNDQSSDEGSLDIEIFASNSVGDEPLNVKEGSFGGRIIQEDIHSESTCLLLWDEDVEPVTEVTYVIEEGQKDPVSIFHTTSHSEGAKVIPLNAGRKSTSLTSNGINCVAPELISCPSPKRRKKGISHEEKRKLPRRVKEKKDKTKQIRECKQCGKTCRSSSNLISHMRTHSGERPYYCDVCGVGFKQIAHLRSHIRIHTGEKPYVCKLCGAAFTQSSRLNSHKRTQHVEGKRPKQKVVRECKIRNFYCPICKKTFLDECFKRDHMEQHRTLDDAGLLKTSKASAEFQCDVCGIVYSNRATFNKHKLQHSDNKLICEVCGCSFGNISALQSHSMVVHGVKLETDSTPGMYINVKIGKEQDFIVVNPSVKNILHGNNFNTEREKLIKFDDDLEENQKTPVIQLTETLDGQVESKVMQDLAYTSEEYTSMKVVHVNKGIKDEPITELDSDSFDLIKVDDYLEQSGSVKLATPNDSLNEESLLGVKAPNKKTRLKFDYINSEGKKIWQCKLCPKIFYQSSNLHCHMRFHTGEKPYKCNVCPKAFKQITHLKEHMYKHTGMKSFGCTTCGAHFTQRGAVKRHINVIHDGKGDIEKVKSFSTRKETADESDCLLVCKKSTKMKEDSLTVSPKLENCDICGKEYTLSYMKSHKRCHTGEKPFKCKYCKAQFRQKSHLKSHLVCHTGKKPFVCSLCGSSYIQLRRLKKHKESCSGKGVHAKPYPYFKKKNLIKREETEKDKGLDFELQNNDKADTDEKEIEASRRLPITEDPDHGSHEDSCNISLSGSELFNDSDAIQYGDESDGEAVMLKKFQRGGLKTPEEKSQSFESNGIESTSKNSSLKRCENIRGSSDSAIVCKLCSAHFKRTSAYNFHYKMKHENGNDDVIGDNSDDGIKRISGRFQTSVHNKIIEKEKVFSEGKKGKDICYQRKHYTNKRNSGLQNIEGVENAKETHNLNAVEVSNIESNVKPNFFCAVCKLSFGESSLLESHIEMEHSFASKGDSTKVAAEVKQSDSPAKVNFLGALDLSDNCDTVLYQRNLDSSGTCSSSVSREDIDSAYICDDCGKSFTRSSKLKHHVSMWCKGKNSNSLVPVSVSLKSSRKHKSVSFRDSEQTEKEQNKANIAENHNMPDPLTFVETVICNIRREVKKQPKGNTNQVSNIE